MAEYIDRNLIEWYGCDFEDGSCEHRECSECSQAECSHTQVMQIPPANVIPIPDGATNGDVFKIVFGYEPATDSVVCNKEDWCGASEPCNYCMSNPDNIGKEEDWWNAPYKAEMESE